MLRGNLGKRRRHPDDSEIACRNEHAFGVQTSIAVHDLLARGAGHLAHDVKRWRPPGVRKMPIHRRSQGQIERVVHARLPVEERSQMRAEPIPPPRRLRRVTSKAIGIDNRGGKRLRRLLRWVVSDASRQQSVRVLSGELLRIRSGIRMRRAVGVTLERDGRHRNHRPRRQLGTAGDLRQGAQGRVRAAALKSRLCPNSLQR
jgi:hypothetical protein